ncbi:MAG: peptidylprolyl isomerase [Dehalococcoidia bacterium]|nr:peptidylprolyl isomerase [Dehalococcoidia bacterium]
MSPSRLLRSLGRRAPLALLSALAILAGACGGGDAGNGQSGSGTPSIGAPGGNATVAPGKDGRVVKDGDKVRVHYRGTLDDGTEFDSSKGRSPLAFQVGSGQVIRGFDDAVRGLAVGEKRTVRMEAKDAYGEVRADLVFEVPIGQAPAGVKAGDRVRMGTGQPATVKEVTADIVKLDANHDLAGKALTFDVELVGID